VQRRLGIVTSMRSDLFGPDHSEAQAAQPGMALQNSKLPKIALDGHVMARQGAMVAYQGQIEFQAMGSGGIGRFIQQKLTGEGIPLMQATGRGDLFLADRARGRVPHRSRRPARRAHHQRRQRARVRAEPELGHPARAASWDAVLVRPVQLRVHLASFAGQGFVVVQPSEEVATSLISGTGSGEQAGAGGILGGLLGR
jgi:hypothetical protein